jgi:hypothetical protein
MVSLVSSVGVVILVCCGDQKPHELPLGHSRRLCTADSVSHLEDILFLVNEAANRQSWPRLADDLENPNFLFTLSIKFGTVLNEDAYNCS